MISMMMEKVIKNNSLLCALPISRLSLDKFTNPISMLLLVISFPLFSVCLLADPPMVNLSHQFDCLKYSLLGSINIYVQGVLERRQGGCEWVFWLFLDPLIRLENEGEAEELLDRPMV